MLMGLWKPRPRRVVERLRSAESFPGSVGSSVAEPFLLDEPVAALPLIERRRQTFEEALRNGYDEFLKSTEPEDHLLAVGCDYVLRCWFVEDVDHVVASVGETRL
jgi:hypothetical protein